MGTLEDRVKELALDLGLSLATAQTPMGELTKRLLAFAEEVRVEARLDEAHQWLMSEGLNNKARLKWKRKRIVDLEQQIRGASEKGR